MITDRRRRPAGSLLNNPFVLTIALLGYTGAIGFGTVWLRHQISVTANGSRALEHQIAELQRQVDEAAAEIAFATGPEQLIQKNTTLDLQLVRPREAQVVRVTDDIERRLAAKRFSRLFLAAGSRAPGEPDE